MVVLMGPLEWLGNARRTATAITRAREVAHADDEVPINQPREPDGAVARGAALLRTVSAAAPARLQASLRFELAGLLRRLGQSERMEADTIYRRLRQEHPGKSTAHWSHALLLKQTGRFGEALDALEAYRMAGGIPDQAFHWNTGICATGAGQGKRALDAWLAEGFKLREGEDGMPFGDFSAVQVRISSSGALVGPPCAPAPGVPDQEYGWVERRSPCHGVLLILMMDEPADVGDLLLWDGAAVRWKEFHGHRVPTFPLLKVLARGGVRRFRFRAEQVEAGLVTALGDALPRGVQLYVHDEQVVWLCQRCASSGAADPHEHRDSPDCRLVSGKLAVPPGVSLDDVRHRLEESLRQRPAVRLAVPALHSAAGDLAAAARDEVLWTQLVDSTAEDRS